MTQPDNNVSPRAKMVGIGVCLAVVVLCPVAFLFSLAAQH
ncbi:hypothetical protein EDF55_0072 [Curtobacterium sp. ZW137]|nr:hypothetical protein EDF55_0072 [Curtobacterium sp. ZW137]